MNTKELKHLGKDCFLLKLKQEWISSAASPIHIYLWRDRGVKHKHAAEKSFTHPLARVAMPTSVNFIPTPARQQGKHRA